MIAKTAEDRQAALTWLQDLLFYMRNAARELRSPTPQAGDYETAMENVKRLADCLDFHNPAPKPKRAPKKPKTKDREKPANSN